jgi:hypothetical protein
VMVGKDVVVRGEPVQETPISSPVLRLRSTTSIWPIGRARAAIGFLASSSPIDSKAPVAAM